MILGGRDQMLKFLVSQFSYSSYLFIFRYLPAKLLQQWRHMCKQYRRTHWILHVSVLSYLITVLSLHLFYTLHTNYMTKSRRIEVYGVDTLIAASKPICFPRGFAALDMGRKTNYRMQGYYVSASDRKY